MTNVPIAKVILKPEINGFTPEPCQQLRGIDEAEHDKSLISNPKTCNPIQAERMGLCCHISVTESRDIVRA